MPDNRPLNIAIIFAGGSGVRMNSKSKPKQFLEHHGKPIIIYTLELFDRHEQIDAIFVACIKDWIPVLEEQLASFGIKKVKGIVPGGKSGQESIYNALCAAKDYAKEKKAIVLIHDGVRPLITPKVISDNIESVLLHGNSITCVPAIETFIIDRGEGKLDIPDRNSVLVARAPQSFYLDQILSAHEKSREQNLQFIDSCMMMTHFGQRMHTLIGPMENIKITTPMDFFVFKALIDAPDDPQLASL